MRGIPSFSACVSMVAETALCQCGGVLEFDTDFNGYVIESCARCRGRGLLTTVKTRPATFALIAPKQPPVPTPHSHEFVPDMQPGPDCRRCGKRTLWLGYGRKRKWCEDCAPIIKAEALVECNKKIAQRRRARRIAEREGIVA